MIAVRMGQQCQGHFLHENVIAKTLITYSLWEKLFASSITDLFLIQNLEFYKIFVKAKNKIVLEIRYLN